MNWKGASKKRLNYQWKEDLRERELKHFKIHQAQKHGSNGKDHLPLVDVEATLNLVYARIVSIFMKLDIIFTLYNVNKIYSMLRVTTQSTKYNYET